MGFPSPANDYIEKRLTIDDFVVANPASTMICDIGDRLLVIDRSVPPKSGSMIYYELMGECGVGKIMGRSLITPDGEAFEGSVLEELEVVGVVTAEILKMHEPDRPII
ncbi:hypothetical protein ACP3TC_05100 [Winslowiella sp. 2C04]|uniref:hypothetical protein n=1 Tax=Winslowiella sp. 2C04 TaxID=3416179 RepID=UPI003CEE5DEB